MYLMGEPQLPEGVLPPPDARDWMQRSADNRAAMGGLFEAAGRVQVYTDASNSREEALQEAYARRISDVKAATGVDLADLTPFNAVATRGGRQGSDLAQRRLDMAAAFTQRLADLARQHPDKAGVIRAAVPVVDDARQLAVAAGRDLEGARRKAEAVGLPGVSGFMAEAGGALARLWRDPVQVLGVFAGGVGSSAGKTLVARVLQRIGTEAAINGGIEAVVQSRADGWRKEAGVEGQGFWTRVGLAASFGGGLGGLAEGFGHVLAARGARDADADAALARLARGEVSDADMRALADRAGSALAEDDLAAVSRALDSDADAAVVRMATDADGVAAQQVDDVVAAIEADAPLPRLADDMEPVGPKAGFVRMYHGGEPGTASGPLWFSSHLPYATGYAQKSGGRVWYVDIPADHPIIRPDWPDQGIAQGFTMNRELPADIAAQRKLLRDPVNLMEDMDYHAFVQQAHDAKIAKLEGFANENAADIAHLKAGGDVAALPSGREFPNLRAASDDAARAKLVAMLEEKQVRATAALTRPRELPYGDPALQIAYAEARASRDLVGPDAVRLGEPGAPEAREAAARTLADAQAADVAADVAAVTDPPAVAVEPRTGTSLDVMDAIPAGTDAEGNVVFADHAAMRSWADRMDHLADVIASCTAA